MGVGIETYSRCLTNLLLIICSKVLHIHLMIATVRPLPGSKRLFPAFVVGMMIASLYWEEKSPSYTDFVHVIIEVFVLCSDISSGPTDVSYALLRESISCLIELFLQISLVHHKKKLNSVLRTSSMPMNYVQISPPNNSWFLLCLGLWYNIVLIA